MLPLLIRLLRPILLLLLSACADAPPPAAPAASTAASTAPSTAASTAPSTAPSDGPTAADAVAPLAGPMDGHPGRRTLSPSQRWEAVVAPGGDLSVRTAGGQTTPLDVEVDPRLVFSSAEDWLVYARRGPLLETDLWRVRLPDGQPQQVTAWTGTEDRPLLSPDGRHLAFVSGRTGIASWWLVDLTGPLPVPEDAGRQLSNIGVEDQPRQPGQPPAGWVPVPANADYAWVDDQLVWVADGREHRLRVQP